MRTLLRIGLLLTGFCAFAQPAAYYNAATATGYDLKVQLFGIIKDHTVKSYNQLYTCYQTSDRDNFYEEDGTILDLYSEKPDGEDSYNYSATNTGDRCGNYSLEGDCYNREHLMPQSVFDEDSPMVSDPHHIIPTDGKVNGMRNNYAFGVVSNPTWTSTNGSKLGNNVTPGYTGIVFEPIDEFKGDIARCLLYFAVRYHDKVGNYDHEMLNGTNQQVFSDWFLPVLLQWHLQDPVSEREIVRNNAIYTFQGNRNPFIDHPEYACLIWSSGCELANEEFSALDKIALYPNPSHDGRFSISSDIALDAIEIYNVNGQIIRTIANPVFDQGTFVVDKLPGGFYIIRLSAQNRSSVKKLMVN